MYSLADFLSQEALLPAGGAMLANVIGIHSLRQPDMSSRRRFVCIAYLVLTIVLTVALVFFGANQHEENRTTAEAALRVEHKLDSLKLLIGNGPNQTTEQVLQRIIDKFAKPREISDIQVSRLAELIAGLKPFLPTIIPIYSMPGDNEAWIYADRLIMVFRRNGIMSNHNDAYPQDPSETGLAIKVHDADNPPLAATKLQDALDLVQIKSTIKTAQQVPPGDFQIFVAPKM